MRRVRLRSRAQLLRRGWAMGIYASAVALWFELSPNLGDGRDQAAAA